MVLGARTQRQAVPSWATYPYTVLVKYKARSATHPAAGVAPHAGSSVIVVSHLRQSSSAPLKNSSRLIDEACEPRASPALAPGPCEPRACASSLSLR